MDMENEILVSDGEIQDYEADPAEETVLPAPDAGTVDDESLTVQVDPDAVIPVYPTVDDEADIPVAYTVDVGGLLSAGEQADVGDDAETVAYTAEEILLQINDNIVDGIGVVGGLVGMIIGLLVGFEVLKIWLT